MVRLYDVGVAGLHRLLAHLDDIMGATVVIAVAGMEGALASVIGGLADCPVIAVPTSVGYGAAFGGLVRAAVHAQFLRQRRVSVVNIDNGFGAGYLASMINHMEAKRMKTLYLDCGMGAAGDMLTAALLELLPEPESIPGRAERAWRSQAWR